MVDDWFNALNIPQGADDPALNEYMRRLQATPPPAAPAPECRKMFGGNAPQSTLQLQDPNAERARGQITGAIQGIAPITRPVDPQQVHGMAQKAFQGQSIPEPSEEEQRQMVASGMGTIPLAGITGYRGLREPYQAGKVKPVEWYATDPALANEYAGTSQGATSGVLTSKATPWAIPQQEVSSASTSISYPDVAAKSPIIFKAFKTGNIDLGPVNADIGGGRYNQITDWLGKNKVHNIVYDPFNRSLEHNQMAKAALTGGKADTATVSNVLNVIPTAEARATTIATAYDALKPGGKAYFSMYNAPKSGMVKGRGAYQVGKKPAEYIPELEAIFGKGNVTKKADILIATKGE